MPHALLMMVGLPRSLSLSADVVGVVTVELLPRLTRIDQTPGYQHLSTESHEMSDKDFPRCQSI